MSKRDENLRGSNLLGAAFLITVFGPMAVLAVLWALAVGTGDAGAARDAFMNAMVWTLLASGVVLVLEETFLVVWASLNRRRD